MLPRSFLEDVDRLFDELVSSPWKRERRARHPAKNHRVSVWEAQLPAHRGDLSVAVAGNTVTVTVTRRASRSRIASGAEITAGTQESQQQTFTIPEGTTVEAVEAGFEGDVLRLRLYLRRDGE